MNAYLSNVNPETRRLFDQILDVVRDNTDILLVILFGSASVGRMRSDSDVDIAIAGRSIFSWDQLQELRLQFNLKLHKEIDLIDLLHTRGLIFYQAMTKGAVVMSRDTYLFGRLMTETVYFAEDMLPSIKKLYERNVWRFILG
ncbi:MAG TPA: nucleotidyltransferase domain-containing protein [Chitinispirillaceae bacterium]|nr:nucleotidyltransferase domain-containing protein [Chitinispirillaceae bacterium]